ncbi:uncharacterized protein RCC_05213 [Ramularia collo-cygni]|uniref:OPA3 domain protein n=1 Tax=Ramularia collo-cygni TaxID=112498 RepID=A0A2D3UYD5_9PEZI|nr:uncharacterized protein RCC_05213 [Ramularia collo-cygni]CZT19365.1 uncharacterized protein RCC_05213 [Ramularia collo-cygni]
MSLTFKLLSLVVRTAAKPIGNYIKRQTKEHEGFRRFAVAQAQRVHRIDMRMRLGILHDADAQQRMVDREVRAAEERKRKAETPIVRTEEEQLKYDAQKAKEEQDAKDGKPKEEKVSSSRPKIKPLSETRAIELGANFFSEAFIFGVAVSLLMVEAWRSRRKESERRDNVADRLEQLELEVEGLRSRLDPDLEDEKALIERVRQERVRKTWSWWNPLSWSWVRGEEDTAIMEEDRDKGEMPEKEKPLVAIHKPGQKIVVDRAEDDAVDAARREERRAEKRKADIEKVLEDKKQAAVLKRREAEAQSEEKSPPNTERKER